MEELPQPRRGEVWTAYTPLQPDDPHQPRPVLVVSADARNRKADDVMVVPIFAIGPSGPTRILIPVEGTGLQFESFLWCEELTTIDKDFLQDGPKGHVSKEILDQVVAAVRRAVGDYAA